MEVMFLATRRPTWTQVSGFVSMVTGLVHAMLHSRLVDPSIQDFRDCIPTHDKHRPVADRATFIRHERDNLV